jgi:RNA polymerase-interacting CarD/CdnL/TRCF family regulator
MTPEEKIDSQVSPGLGDWLVHQYYGVGQLKGKETKNIGGVEGTYFRLEMDRSTIYVPEDKLNSDWFRPVSSQKKFAEVREILSRPAQQMDGRFSTRQTKIRKVMSENSIVNIARIIRDLSARRRRRKTLSKTEDSALRELTDRLLSEWAIATGLEEAEAREKLKELLDHDAQE